MASRQDEKEARRKARVEAEQLEAKEAARQRRIQLVLGGVLALVIVVGAVVLVINAGGKGGDDGSGRREAKASPSSATALPKQATADEQQAAKAASCTLATHPIEGRQHENRTFTEADYKTNPPTSGTHFPQWAQDGVYDAGSTPPLGQLVHTLEHGRIDVQYKPGTPKAVVGRLEAFVAENEGYHMVMFQNPTGMDAQVAATAWGKSLTCAAVGDKTWDALRTFRDAHLDQGPEKIP